MEDTQALKIHSGRNQSRVFVLSVVAVFRIPNEDLRIMSKLAIHQVGGETNLGGSSSRKFTSETGPVCFDISNYRLFLFITANTVSINCVMLFIIDITANVQ